MTEQAKIVFFITTLTSEELREEYENWVRDTDTPLATSLDGVSSYRVVRLEAPVMDGVDVLAGYSYLEIIEVSDLAAYQQAIAGTPASFFEQFRTYIADFVAVSGTVIN